MASASATTLRAAAETGPGSQPAFLPLQVEDKPRTRGKLSFHPRPRFPGSHLDLTTRIVIAKRSPYLAGRQLLLGTPGGARPDPQGLPLLGMFSQSMHPSASDMHGVEPFRLD